MGKESVYNWYTNKHLIKLTVGLWCEPNSHNNRGGRIEDGNNLLQNEWVGP
jgi:hypothetical protein